MSRATYFDDRKFLFGAFQDLDQTALPALPHIDVVVHPGRGSHVLACRAEGDMVPGESLDKILKLVLHLELESVEVDFGITEVGQVQRADNPVTRVDDNIPPRRRQTDIDNDVVRDSIRVLDLVGGRVDYVQPALIGAGDDVLARGGEEGHGSGLLCILSGLLLGGILALELGAARGRGNRVADGDLG